METSSSLFSCYILLSLFFFFLLIEKNFLVSARELAGEHHVIDVKSLLPSSSCSMTDKRTSPSRLNVVHWHGLCSSQARQDKSSHGELLRRDQARVDYIHRRIANSNAQLNPISDSLFAYVPVSVGYALSSNDYIINIGLGTPTKYFSVSFDTASDLTWTQCVPCINCYIQKDPLYDPIGSSTFTDISCNSDYCTQLYRHGCSSTSTCLYEESYFDYSRTNGSLIQDTLTLSSDIIHNFTYGCGHDNTGHFGQVDGILGLGRGAVSIISQTAQLYDNVFSYCLPSGSNTIGYLLLGRSIPGVNYTPMLTNPYVPSLYFLKLIAICIGDTRIDFSPIGTVLDSGTTFSHLPPSVYSVIRSIFKNIMANYPTAPPLFNLDTCYDLTNYTNVQVPSMSLIYDGEVITYLDGSGIIYEATISQMCLAFAQNNDDSQVTIIGATQQRTFNVVYDVGNLKIGFGSNGCK